MGAIGKNCGLCGRAASRFAIFEATLAPGILPRMPYKWLCEDHCKSVWAEVLIKDRKFVGVRSVQPGIDLKLFDEAYAALRRRSPDAWAAREAQEEPISLLLCPSKLTEAEVAELEKAFSDGRTIKEGRAPDVEYMSPEEAAREIARAN